MGLFLAIIHLRDVNRGQAQAALDKCLQNFRYTATQSFRATEGAPDRTQWNAHDRYYALSERHGHWLAIVDLSTGYSEDLSIPFSLSKCLTQKLSTYGLSFRLHDGDVLYYELSFGGRSLDCYVSDPEYFGELTAAEIDAERHNPEALKPVLINGVTVEDVRQILDAGWWYSYDRGQAREPTQDLSAPNRMERLGSLLRLYGDRGLYPFGSGLDSGSIDWKEFVVLRYSGMLQ